jgi:hypothetical protein
MVFTKKKSDKNAKLRAIYGKTIMAGEKKAGALLSAIALPHQCPA